MKPTLVSAVAVLLALSGCEADPSRDVAERIEPGICVAKEIIDQGNPAPDLSSIVDCTEPHAYEVYEVLDLPQEALTGEDRQERIDNRDDLALPDELFRDSAQREVYEEFATRGCAASLQQVAGYDDLRLLGVEAEEARIVPVLRGVSARYTVMPEKEWLDGRRQVVCSVRFDDVGYTGSGRRPTRPASAPTDALLISGARSPSFPVTLRQCRAYDAARTNVSLSTCAKPHATEMLFYFDAEAVFGRAFVRSLRAKPTPKKFDRLDRVCAQALPALLGEGSDRTEVRGFGSVSRRWTVKDKPVRCDVGSIRFRTTDLAPGSLVGIDDQEVELVPAS